MAAYRRVCDSRHMQADCKETGISSGTLLSAIKYGLHLPFIRVVGGAGSMKRLGFRPSVRLPVCLSQQRAAGLLLCARRAGDIDRLAGVEAAQRIAA